LKIPLEENMFFGKKDPKKDNSPKCEVITLVHYMLFGPFWFVIILMPMKLPLNQTYNHNNLENNYEAGTTPFKLRFWICMFLFYKGRRPYMKSISFLNALFMCLP
jgi:hypothetical protein